MVEESHRGHRQVSSTARRHGICRSLLTIWRPQYRNGELSAQGGPAFVPVEMPKEMDTPPHQIAPAVQIEIVLRDERRLLVPSLVDPDDLHCCCPFSRVNDRFPGGGARLDCWWGDRYAARHEHIGVDGPARALAKPECWRDFLLSRP
nr:transposase [Tropicibacter alexandrii]